MYLHVLSVQQRLAGKQAGGLNRPSGSKPPIKAEQTEDWVPERYPDCSKKLKDTGEVRERISETFNFYLQLKLSAGGPVQMWDRLAELLFAWHQQIREQSLDAAIHHADETGWRVQRWTRWIWCFASDDAID
ncbi:MAG: transposase [Planctomycetota bacterium]